jgi:hypothetical protein
MAVLLRCGLFIARKGAFANTCSDLMTLQDELSDLEEGEGESTRENAVKLAIPLSQSPSW